MMRKIRKNDEVMVILGRSRGKKGKVLVSIPGDDRLIVEGINMIKRHTRPRGKMRQAGIIEREAPLHISDVKLICKKCNRPTRVGFRLLEDKSRVRSCKKCGEVID
ncbi:MAG: 50S ribosomal protein L24 [Dehalococcoidia bacterium]|nr:50S ribosomal protein L24 [Dehalococcoidia bacterium]MCL0034331.1 50S ribosomal protein L24 [Dehalococcoidia bacterium]MCL0056005.1 50S ribosomal protein L24 [Dehalococcoidia bacterium]MCL0063674.1 50S ribosomal protein L24 [Dehalococcoidia bacterium]MCL0098549.1 50S ribosomal protein L24 [Dehalococcoidia bacterium]